MEFFHKKHLRVTASDISHNFTLHERVRLLSHEFGLEDGYMTKDSSVIRQKSESQKCSYKKQSTPNFPKNKHFLPPDTYLGVKRVNFSENMECFVLL